MTPERAEWEKQQAEETARTGAHGFDPGMPWRIAYWYERLGILFFWFVMWGVIFPAVAVGGLLVVGSALDGYARLSAEKAACQHRAEKPYDYHRC